MLGELSLGHAGFRAGALPGRWSGSVLYDIIPSQALQRCRRWPLWWAAALWLVSSASWFGIPVLRLPAIIGSSLTLAFTDRQELTNACNLGARGFQGLYFSPRKTLPP